MQGRLRARTEELRLLVQPLVAALETVLGEPVVFQPAMGTSFFLRGEHTELYLRYCARDGSLVCASITVQPQRQGIGTRVTAALIAFARQCGLRRFVIEGAHTRGSRALARKFGMKPHPTRLGDWYLDP